MKAEVISSFFSNNVGTYEHRTKQFIHKNSSTLHSLPKLFGNVSKLTNNIVYFVLCTYTLFRGYFADNVFRYLQQIVCSFGGVEVGGCSALNPGSHLYKACIPSIYSTSSRYHCLYFYHFGFRVFAILPLMVLCTILIPHPSPGYMLPSTNIPKTLLSSLSNNTLISTDFGPLLLLYCVPLNLIYERDHLNLYFSF